MPARGARSPGGPLTRTGTVAFAPCWSAERSTRVSPDTAPSPHKPGLLPVQDFIPALHIKPEVRKCNRDRLVLPSNEVPGSVICHFLPFLSVLPAPLALLIPEKLGAVRTGNSGRVKWASGRDAPQGVLTWFACWFWSGRRPNPRWLAPVQTLAYIQWRRLT